MQDAIAGDEEEVLHGTLDLSTTFMEQYIGGEGKDDMLGYSIAKGDLNGDRKDDLILGAPGYHGTCGGVLVYYGGSKERVMGYDDADIIIDHDEVGTHFGLGIETGDVNNDGYTDILVSGYAEEVFGKGEYEVSPKVFLFLGQGVWPSIIHSIDADTIFMGSSNQHLFGYDIAMGDITGDGFDDILISEMVEGGGSSGGHKAGKKVLVATLGSDRTDTLISHCSSLGIEYDVYTASQISSMSGKGLLKEYYSIWTGCQEDITDATMMSLMDGGVIEEYVRLGGIFIANGAHNTARDVYGPGHSTFLSYQVSATTDESPTVADADHEWITGEKIDGTTLTASNFASWGTSCHGAVAPPEECSDSKGVNLGTKFKSDMYNNILWSPANSKAALMEYTLDNGYCIIDLMTFDWGSRGNNELLQMLKYVTYIKDLIGGGGTVTNGTIYMYEGSGSLNKEYNVTWGPGSGYDHILTNTINNTGFGLTDLDLGDINDDGYMDILIGSGGMQYEGEGAGGVQVLFGGDHL
ncbi:MAG: FG-GAP repeat protein, partial [Candidatus Thermoplasmatota archaeon]|nr:FG-GAP repeat protein [Candidatus Thermoplasmatota archaeon]